MSAKPDMKPWVNIKQKKLRAPLGAALLSEHLSCVSEVPPLKGLNKCVSMINPGLAPWAMQEYRAYGTRKAEVLLF